MNKSILVIFFLIFCYGAPQSILTESDQLNKDGNYETDLLNLTNKLESFPQDVEVLWRLARAHFEIADQTEDEEIDKKYLYPGFKYAKMALGINSNSARANHWYAVLIGQIGLLEGTEQKIINSYDVEKYALRAIKLDPNYDGAYSVMGRWHYELASLSWFERKIAEWVYESPPNGGYTQAVEYYKKAIKAKPDEIRHYLWLGKSLVELEDITEAKKIFENILNMNPGDTSDKNMQLEAKEYLEQL